MLCYKNGKTNTFHLRWNAMIHRESMVYGRCLWKATYIPIKSALPWRIVFVRDTTEQVGRWNKKATSSRPRFILEDWGKSNWMTGPNRELAAQQGLPGHQMVRDGHSRCSESICGNSLQGEMDTLEIIMQVYYGCCFHQHHGYRKE